MQLSLGGEGIKTRVPKEVVFWTLVLATLSKYHQVLFI